MCATGRGAAHVDSSAFVLRAGGLTTQLAAARAGFGVLLVSSAVGEVYGLVPVRMKGAAKEAVATAPREHVWLVGHRALRNVPRVAAVWDAITSGAERFTSGRRLEDAPTLVATVDTPRSSSRTPRKSR